MTSTHHSIIVIIIHIAVIVAAVIEVVDRCEGGVVFHSVRVHKCIVYQRIVQSHFINYFVYFLVKLFLLPRFKVSQQND